MTTQTPFAFIENYNTFNVILPLIETKTEEIYLTTVVIPDENGKPQAQKITEDFDVMRPVAYVQLSGCDAEHRGACTRHGITQEQYDNLMDQPMFLNMLRVENMGLKLQLASIQVKPA